MTEHHNTSHKRLTAEVLLQRGIATLADVAWLTGASRQLVRYWARQAGIDSAKQRAAYLEAEWRRAMEETRSNS